VCATAGFGGTRGGLADALLVRDFEKAATSSFPHAHAKLQLVLELVRVSFDVGDRAVWWPAGRCLDGVLLCVWSRSTLWVANAGLSLEDLVPKLVVYVSQSSPKVALVESLIDPEEEWDPRALCCV
jgi:hypothetical protein